MNKQNDRKETFPAKSKTAYSFLKWICIIWSFVIAVPLIPFPAPSALVGHPWKVELAASAILSLLLICFLFQTRKEERPISISNQFFYWIFLPCCAFILWSAASAFWAGSYLSVTHHTLVWASYLIFFLLAARIVSDKKLFKISLASVGAVTAIVAASCVIEYTFASEIKETFGFRYSRYAEIFAALLPLAFAFVLRSREKRLILATSIAFALWLAVLFTTSRTALLASVVGLFVFFSLRIFSRKTAVEKKRLVLGGAGIVLLAVAVQFPIFSSVEEKATTISRFSSQVDKSADNSVSQNIRLLFYQVGLEMFSHNRLQGVGADNFGLEFNKYRESFSANPENRTLAGQQDWRLPERAHNEYLQILTELGVVGGIIFSCFIFGIAKLSFTEIKKPKSDRYNILTHSATAGIVAFLVSSFFSSFSFRLMQNGLVFFFLLAILLRKHFLKKVEEKSVQFYLPRQAKLAFASISLALCLSLTIFSSLKAASQYFVYQGERQSDFETAKIYFEQAAVLDPANAAADFSYGLRLLNENHYQESAAQLREAIEKGLNTTVCYSYLISAQTLSNELEQAEKTNAEAVRIFPYSVFIRVRYASLLEKLHLTDESVKQYELARQLDKKQAETWRVLINNGATVASRRARTDTEILNLMELYPSPALYAVLTEREILYPEEKAKLDFSRQ
ncbi:MAG: O-antigen ligase family protein [Acidobacteriota bacterium]|nr:O-antigen ligase family protein [Acidobacteriota bacterium]